MSSSNLSPDSLTAVLLSSMHRLETVEPTEYTSVLQDSLTHHKISVPKLQNQVIDICLTFLTISLYYPGPKVKLAPNINHAIPTMREAMIGNEFFYLHYLKCRHLNKNSYKSYFERDLISPSTNSLLVRSLVGLR